MKQYVNNIYFGLKSLVVGLVVTFKAMIQPVVTVQYPREEIDITPNYRGHIELVPNPETGESSCIICGMCAKECPSECITVKSEKSGDGKTKVLSLFVQDFTKCSLCGLCVENCPKGAIQFSDEYDLAGFTKEMFHFDLIKRLKERQ
ncbi:MAG: NADH-quinone oxidoreductase subunit I [Desulfobacterales bacterium]|nr:NADH-quinone oxidoreductase subunit I [Desulfobacterales bacterium]